MFGAGLAAGDQVLKRGSEELKDGAKVQTRPAAGDGARSDRARAAMAVAPASDSAQAGKLADGSRRELEAELKELRDAYAAEEKFELYEVFRRKR